MNPINCIRYTSLDTGYVVMGEIGLWRTTNRGQNWLLLDSIPLNYIGDFDLQILKADRIGYSVGIDLRIYKTDSGYENWQKLILNENFADVFFINEMKGYFTSSSHIGGPLFRTLDGGGGNKSSSKFTSEFIYNHSL